MWRALAGFGVFFHFVAFVAESLLWMRPEVHGGFGVKTLAEAEALRLLCFNQGFYNLFLALGCAVGIVLAGRGRAFGQGLLALSCLSMGGAGLVLACSAPDKLGAAFLQGGPPLLALAVAYRARPAGSSSTAPAPACD